ncbi:MAG: helix-turn-helix domain-containing protein [Clostridia bacterium]|nr:helix-turn-helix domain-containing protein [Clostridia bacterium]
MAFEYTHKGDEFVFENYIPSSGSEILYIQQAGYTSPRGSYHIKRKASVKNVMFVIEYILDGKGYIIYDGKKYSVGKGDFYMLDDTHDHQYYSDQNEPLSKIWINAYGSFIEKNVESFGFPHIIIQHVDVEEELLAIHNMLKGKTAYEAKEMTAELCVGLFRLFYKVYVDYRDKREHGDRLFKIQNYIQEHITDGVTVEKICADNFISKSTLYRLFKTELGISPTEYIKNQKIRIACRILKLTSIDISEIVRQLGFYDNSHFSRTFYSVMNISPAAYRKSKDKKLN